MLDAFLRDVRHAAKSLRRSPSYAVVCVVSLWIGMAPVVAASRGVRVFDVPPRDFDTKGLVEIITERQGPQAATDVWSFPDYQDLKHAVTGMLLTAWSRGTSVLTEGARRRAVSVMYVDTDYFATMRGGMRRGSGMDANTTAPVAILAYEFWQNRQNGDVDIVGKALVLDGESYTVIGVAAAPFHGHLGVEGAEVFLPLAREPHLRPDATGRLDRRDRWVHLHSRLADGMTIAGADDALRAATVQLSSQYPATNELTRGTVKPYHPTGNLFLSNLLIIKGVVYTLTGFVLLVVCANLGGMMQVRSAMRERDLSIRQSLGANRPALVRYLLAESTILAGLGAVLASVTLFAVKPLAGWFADGPLPYPLEQVLRVDGAAVFTCVLLCLLAGVFFGLLPAMRFSRPAIISTLKDDAVGGGLRVGRVHRVTAAVQIAIAVPLLVMGGISLDRVRSTTTSDLGFSADLVYAAPLPFESGQDVLSAVRRAGDELASFGAVASVTAADGLPLDFRYRMRPVAVAPPEGSAPRWVQTHVTRVGDRYLHTMGIRVTRGRDFTSDDRAGSELVTVIAEPLANVLAPGADAGELIGRQILYGNDPKTQKRLTIVGVTNEFPTSQMSTERAQLLVPLSQHPDLRADSAQIGDDVDITPRLMLVARAAPGAAADAVIAALEHVISARDSSFTRRAVVTGRSLRENSVRDFLTQTAVAGVAGAVILTLAALGVYGVVGLMVATRTRELALRIALGATPLHVVRLVLAGVVRLSVPGIILGLLLAVVLIRLNAENMGVPLSGVEAVAYPAGGAAALLVAVIASLGPARRAASVQPMLALKRQ